MKNIIFTFIILASLSCTAQPQKTYQLQTEKSTIIWKGSYMFQMSEHKGTVKFLKGELTTENESIIGGSFSIDMTSITNPEYEEAREGPVDHLKNKDFFYVNKYPKAHLKIISVIYHAENNMHQFIADLTIKDTTQAVEFWGIAFAETNQITTQFKIDRTRWGINHNNNLKDHAISEAIEFDVILQF